MELNIPTGVPLVYELDATLKPMTHYDLGDPEAIRTAREAIATPGKAKGYRNNSERARPWPGSQFMVSVALDGR